jgi:ubiquinone/menaquinone biosynthesis C-methylase UbiE
MAVAIDRSVFVTGEYVECFHPEDTGNPFHRLYARKRLEVVATARALLGDRSEARVLDIGGGMGRIAVPLAATYDVTLCDVSEAMLALAHEAAGKAGQPLRLAVQRVDASQPLLYADGTFDLIVCLDLLPHLPDPQAALRELARVLTPGGTAIIDNSNSVPFWTFFYPRYVGRRPSRWWRTLKVGGVLPEWAGIVRHYRHGQFVQMLTAAGFEVREERRYGPWGCPKWHLAVVGRQDAVERS